MQTLLPPRPHERVGWGRLKRIWCEYPTAPVEILIGLGNLARGLYVLWPGHHDTVNGFPSWLRLLLAVVMAAGGALQLHATVFELDRLRALCGIVLCGVLVGIGGFYAGQLTGREDIYAVIVIFYGLMAVGEFWIAYRTPPVFPIWRWLGLGAKSDRRGRTRYEEARRAGSP